MPRSQYRLGKARMRPNVEVEVGEPVITQIGPGEVTESSRPEMFADILRRKWRELTGDNGMRPAAERKALLASVHGSGQPTDPEPIDFSGIPLARSEQSRFSVGPGKAQGRLAELMAQKGLSRKEAMRQIIKEGSATSSMLAQLDEMGANGG